MVLKEWYYSIKLSVSTLSLALLLGMMITTNSYAYESTDGLSSNMEVSDNFNRVKRMVVIDGWRPWRITSKKDKGSVSKGRLFPSKLFGYNNKNQGGIMNLFILECKRILNDKIFIAVLFFNILFYLYVNYSMDDIYSIIMNNFYMRLFFLSPNTIELTNGFYFILPILSCLVGSDVMAQDMRSKEFINILSRVNKKKYFLCKAVLSFVSAGIVMITPFLLDFIVKLAIYPTNLPCVISGARFPDVMGMSDIFVYNPMLYTILAILFTFLFSGLLGLVGFLISLFTNKKLVIISVPFIITIVIWNLVNILGIKDYSIASMLIFRIVQNIHTFNQLATAFIIPFLIVVFMSFMRGKKYDYI